jgi:hypothetical protein
MPPPLAEPLTESELDRLDDFLCRVNHGKGMTLEGLDGFLCALICGPELVPSSEYLPHVWGGELIQGRGFDSIEQAAVSQFEVSSKIAVTVMSNPAMKRATRLALAPSSPLPRGAKNAPAIRKTPRARKKTFVSLIISPLSQKRDFF